jgi:RimJ/RimL family protein N-acetyltransferase
VSGGWPTPVALNGTHVRLEPLRPDHAPALAEAVREGDLSGTWYTVVPTPESMSAEIERRLGLQAVGSMRPFAVLDADGVPGGMTTYMHIDARFHLQSRRAIERLGAQLDGILRHHQRTADGSLRDTCVYSITAPEWPTVHQHLRARLDAPTR